MDYLTILNNREADGEVCRIELQLDNYSKSTVFKTIYKFTERAYFFITTQNNVYTVYITPKDKNFDLLTTITDEFTNELLDQELRTLVLKETSTVRDIIMTRALLAVNGK